MAAIKRFLLDEEAASATEYAIMLSLLLMVIVSTVATLGTKANNAFNNAASNL
ncbi:Flp family type IVb pilin [Schlesneria paludicola]|uniref:Flp family type IVb pilin n=1 Tax=Schlesneria paludicola TaxID=360056 RepID=UPI00030FB331|nr:Flp family type IVb pilin [Schlesneria paludicola]